MKLSKKARILILLVIDSLFFLAEIILGYYVGSLSLVADAFHMLNDVLSLVVALYAIKLATAPSSARNSYGWQRAEILGALINGVFLVAISVSIGLQSIERFVSPEEISDPRLVVIVGCLGVASNVVGLFLFHEHGHAHGGHSHSHSHDEVEAAPHPHSSATLVHNNDLHPTHSHLSHAHSHHSRIPPHDPSELYVHPSQTRRQVIQTAHEMGYNSVYSKRSSISSLYGTPAGSSASAASYRESEKAGAHEKHGNGARRSWGKGWLDKMGMQSAIEEEEEQLKGGSSGTLAGHLHHHRPEQDSSATLAARGASSSALVLAPTLSEKPHQHGPGCSHHHSPQDVSSYARVLAPTLPEKPHQHGPGCSHHHPPQQNSRAPDHDHGHAHDYNHDHRHPDVAFSAEVPHPPSHAHSQGGHPHGGHSHGHMNMHGVFLHVLGDFFGNIGVIVSGIIIWFGKSRWTIYMDPTISLLITVIILFSAIPLCRSASYILLQGVPSHIALDDVRQAIHEISDVEAVHELHVWQLNENTVVGSVHVLVKKGQEARREFMEVAEDVREVMHEFGIHSVTIQPEFYDPGTAPEDLCLVRCPPENCAAKTCCPPPVTQPPTA
ncbi:hypothetical protein L202_04667 [Cryptococcus amylolentus CBS 6039]|uniref:Cation efflux protein n=1 Tax=Cryptococcus amylolentus CBS 6039 TaxID=1295533 RepID=A0A1E3HMD9_9TREE|nr:hypothetical protein L202_04667 [Cryptococcus amylolentus CBS 6039]ODN77494.1 hypothetical protein L202_04667 [Cryptococcus amylolentus CBS 6039]